ncbi:MAG: dehydrogenase [Rhodospirillales bacterium]|nr:dehydrogenase [Rhodospirillales bacterium]
MARLSGKVAIVTGAAQGIGAAYAQALGAEGAKVVLADVADTATAVAAMKKNGGEAIGVVADVTDGASVAVMVQSAVKAFGRVDILVNNAAIFGKLALKPFTDISSAEWDSLMAVNVRGVFECTKAVTPEMRKRKYGKIINIASGTVFKGNPMLMHYVASKGAVIAITRCSARELGDDGIRVNCLAPGLTLSENVRNSSDWSDQMITSNISTRAIKREETPEDLVGAVIFLASPDSDFMTGQTMVVDGGSVMH